MFKTTSIIVMAALCIILTANAQQKSSAIYPLKIGDTIPEALWKMSFKAINHPQGDTTINLGKYKNSRLLILDFWATWCSPCIASINKLTSICKDYADQITLMPIASHQGPSIEMAEVMMKEKGWNVPSIYDQDQYLFTKIFPAPIGSGIPHMIWIKDNKILAIPKTEYATRENMLKALRGEKLDMVMDTTNYYPLDYTKPLFVKNNGETGLYFNNRPYSAIARYLPGYGTGRKLEFLRSGDTSILAAVNRKLEDLLFDAYQPMIFPNLDAHNGIVWQVSDSLKNRLFNGPKYDVTHLLSNELAWKEWLNQNTYGYNLRFPENLREKEAFYFMQQDLQKFFGIYLKLKMSIAPAIKHKYATLRLLGTKNGSINRLKHKGTKMKPEQIGNREYAYFQHYKQGFLAKLNESLPDLTIKAIIDSTGISPDLRVDYQFPKIMPRYGASLNKELRRYGLELIIREKYVPVLVVKEEESIVRKKAGDVPAFNNIN